MRCEQGDALLSPVGELQEEGERLKSSRVSEKEAGGTMLRPP